MIVGGQMHLKGQAHRGYSLEVGNLSLLSKDENMDRIIGEDRLALEGRQEPTHISFIS